MFATLDLATVNVSPEIYCPADVNREPSPVSSQDVAAGRELLRGMLAHVFDRARQPYDFVQLRETGRRAAFPTAG